MTRARCSDREVAKAILMDYIDSPGKLVYSEDFKKSVCDRGMIMKHVSFLKSLAEKTGGTFAQSWLQDLVAEVVTAKDLVKSKDVLECSAVLSRRLRVMMRHYLAAVGKKAQWLGTANMADHRETAGAADKNDDDWYVGFDEELNKAWRTRTQDGAKEYSSDIYVDDKHQLATDVVFCMWEDDFRRPITDVTVETWNTKLAARATVAAGKRVASPTIWSGVMPDGVELFVKKRSDRDPLISLYTKTPGKDKQQRLQVKIKYFATEGEAETFMTKIAQDVSQGAVGFDELLSHRNALLLKMGKTLPRCGEETTAMKRPAAAGIESKVEEAQKPEEPQKKRIRGKTAEPSSGGPEKHKKDGNAKQNNDNKEKAHGPNKSKKKTKGNDDASSSVPAATMAPAPSGNGAASATEDETDELESVTSDFPAGIDEYVEAHFKVR